jgi:CysZ protein
MPDRRFRGVLLRAIGITLAILIAANFVVIWGLGWLIGDSLTLPWIGTVQWLDDAISWAAIPVMLVLSAFLMIPVASAITSMFLDEVAQAVEDKHYPGLGVAEHVPFADGLADCWGGNTLPSPRSAGWGAPRQSASAAVTSQASGPPASSWRCR